MIQLKKSNSDESQKLKLRQNFNNKLQQNKKI